MNTAETMRHADRQGSGPASTRSRRSSIPTPTPRRWWPTPTSSCRTRPISSAGTASRCSTGRSAAPTGRPTRSASRWSQPDRDVRPFQDVLIDLGARLGPAGLRQRGRRAALSRRLSRLHRQPRAQARHRPARRLARRGRRARPARARRTREPARRLHRQRLLLAASSCRTTSATSSTPTAAISTGRSEARLHRQRRADRPPALFRAAAEVPARGARATAPIQPPERDRERIETYFDPLPFWYPPFEAAADRRPRTSRCMRSPSGRWPCITPGDRRTPGCARSSRRTAST